MHPQIKVATCCYCGARSMLKPTARDGHELACGSCGAPLHEMKWLKSPDPQPQPVKQTQAAQPNFAAFSKPSKKSKPKKRKHRKPFWRKALEEVWDEVEDIFD